MLEVRKGASRDGWEALIAGTDTMQPRCNSSGTIESRPLPSLEQPRHTCRWTLASSALAARQRWQRKLTFGQCLLEREELYKTVQQRVDGEQKWSVQVYWTRIGG